MRFPSILAVAIACLLSGVSGAQMFPNAPWNKSACERGQCVKVFGVGSIEPDGAVVTYVGPVVDPVPSLAPPAPVAVASVEATSIVERVAFRKALMQAARNARAKDKITVAEYFAIAAMSRVPRVLANLEASMHEAAIEEGIATTQAPDWNAIIEFIERLIPLILQLIELFSSNTVHADLNAIQYAAIQPAMQLDPARARWIGLASLAA